LFVVSVGEIAGTLIESDLVILIAQKCIMDCL